MPSDNNDKNIDPTDLTKLPALPTVLLELLQAFGGEDVDFSALAAICAKDPVVTARMLAVANSAAFRRRPGGQASLDRALVTLGLETVKTIAVTIALMQAFAHQLSIPRDEIARFWTRALASAQLARALARTIGYPDPAEAYLAGLLHDIGQLIIAAQRRGGYAQILTEAATPRELLEREQALFGTDHCQVGAALVTTWCLRSFLADACRYHHEPASTLVDAHPLVRLTHVANALEAGEASGADAFEAGDLLFGLTPSMLRELRNEARAAVSGLAGPLGIAVGPDVLTADGSAQRTRLKGESRLISEVRTQSLAAGLREHLGRDSDEPALLATLAQVLGILFGIDRTRYFLPVDGRRLRGLDPWDEGGLFDQLECAVDHDGSRIGRAFETGEVTQATTDAAGLAVLDRQVMGRAGGMLCLPLTAADGCQGVAVVETAPVQLARLLTQTRLLTLLGAEAGRALAGLRERGARRQREEEDRRLIDQGRLHRAVHEANNPLTIVQSYLDLMADRVQGDPGAEEDLEVLRQEIDRVGGILLRLVDGEQAESGDRADADTAAALRRLAAVLDQALCHPRGIQLQVDCPDAVPPLRIGQDALKQVLVNLVRNAVEAVGDGGHVGITLRSAVNVDGKTYVELAVSDDGPGVRDDAVSSLFQPMSSLKAGHAGLGLVIVRNLIKTAGGMVSYHPRTGRGSRFQVLLPPSEKQHQRRDG